VETLALRPELNHRAAFKTSRRKWSHSRKARPHVPPAGPERMFFERV
jgi:hypothetical protein